MFSLETERLKVTHDRSIKDFMIIVYVCTIHMFYMYVYISIYLCIHMLHLVGQFWQAWERLTQQTLFFLSFAHHYRRPRMYVCTVAFVAPLISLTIVQ